MELVNEMQDVSRKKKLFITCLKNDLPLFVLEELTISKEQTLMMKSYGNVISQPFDSIIRNVVLSIYKDDVDEIYILGELDKDMLEEKDILRKMTDDGITENTIKTLEYLEEPIGDDLYRWLNGNEGGVESNIQQSRTILKNHPLIPKRIQVHGLLVNSSEKKVEFL